MRRRSPSKRARSRPRSNSMPSTTERSARSLACKSPLSCGALRVPLRLSWVASEPRSRQPGGASADQAPMRGSWARSWPLSAASAGQRQPPSVMSPARLASPSRTGARRVRSWPSAVPARSLSQRHSALRSSPRARTDKRASRRPAATRTGSPSVVSACSVRSPLLRASCAFKLSAGPITASHSPSNSRGPAAPAATAGKPASSAQASGMPLMLPALLTCPACQRAACQFSTAGLVAPPLGEAGACKLAWPAPMSICAAAPCRLKARCEASRQTPGPQAGSCTDSCSCCTLVCQRSAAPVSAPPSAFRASSKRRVPTCARPLALTWAWRSRPLMLACTSRSCSGVPAWLVAADAGMCQLSAGRSSEACSCGSRQPPCQASVSWPRPRAVAASSGLTRPGKPRSQPRARWASAAFTLSWPSPLSGLKAPSAVTASPGADMDSCPRPANARGW